LLLALDFSQEIGRCWLVQVCVSSSPQTSLTTFFLGVQKEPPAVAPFITIFTNLHYRLDCSVGNAFFEKGRARVHDGILNRNLLIGSM